MSEAIVLVHGYFRTSSDMNPLEHYFRDKGYVVFSLNLNTTFGSLQECTEDMKYKILTLGIEKENVSFVGHSFGGLIIRHYLSQYRLPNLQRCVLIATPNKGSKLADIGMAILGSFPLNPFKSLDSLQTSISYISPPLNSPPPEIGVIAGNKCNLILGNLLASENDGRVEVNSTKFDDMKDFIVLPYGHHEIHHREETAKLIDMFLKVGSFRSNQDYKHSGSSSYSAR
jgi:pimeloyl-ACP methyl ester carboxylesterase